MRLLKPAERDAAWPEIEAAAAGRPIIAVDYTHPDVAVANLQWCVRMHLPALARRRPRVCFTTQRLCAFGGIERMRESVQLKRRSAAAPPPHFFTAPLPHLPRMFSYLPACLPLPAGWAARSKVRGEAVAVRDGHHRLRHGRGDGGARLPACRCESTRLPPAAW